MIGQEILRLPEIPEGTPETQLRAIRSYLYRLTEQLQYLLAAEKEERMRGQAQCSREAFGSIQRQMLDSPQTAQLISAILGRQLGEKYVALGSLEGFLQREMPGYWDALHRLCRLEEKPEWEILDGARLCLRRSARPQKHCSAALPARCGGGQGAWRTEFRPCRPCAPWKKAR